MKRLKVVSISLTLSLMSHMAAADVVAVVSSKSTVTSLSQLQMVGIFLGKTSRFPNGVPAVPIDQAEGSVARDEFYEKLAVKSAAQMKAYWSKIIFTGRGQPPREVTSGADVKKFLAANPTAIGYIDADLVDSSVRVVQ
jgi:ABC-type phosphate transport system substrate-binding protein